MSKDINLKPLPKRSPDKPKPSAKPKPEPPPVVRLKVTLNDGFILGLGFWIATFFVGLILSIPAILCGADALLR